MILDPTLLTSYLVLATLLAIAPGPDMLFVVASGLRHKTRGAVASALGISAGALVHALAAAAGISAIVAASPLGFSLLRYAGAAYLAYLGLQALWSCLHSTQPNGVSPALRDVSTWRVFQKGLTTNVLNPKVIVFYLALLPQFVNIDLGSVGLQTFLLGCIHNVIGTIVLICAGFFSGRASEWLLQTRFAKWMDGLAGVVFIAMAMRLAFSDKTAS